MINKDTKIELIKELEVTDLSGEKVMIDFSTGKYFMLKGAANDIWDQLKSGITVGEIVSGLLKIYDVEEEVCLSSVITFVEQLQSYEFAKLS